MKAIERALIGGVLGALTTNVLHEITRRQTDQAPRVDLLGMQALARVFRSARAEPPVGRSLYVATLAGDLLSNSVYFALSGAGPRESAILRGMLLGVIAGAGAVLLPKPLGLSTRTTALTVRTMVLTCALYTAGGTVAGFFVQREN